MVVSPATTARGEPREAPRAAAAGPRLGYQPALDGLRAVAAGAVLLYHGDVGWASGGFLGVDVFFVLSGFLITSLLVAEWERTGGIAIGRFYGRRVRRLFPALLLVLGAVLVYAVRFAPDSQLHELRGDIFATLGYVTNWRFVFANRGYFQQFALPSPLKHTWSLAVEEQWYLVWPVTVYALLRLTARGRADGRRRLTPTLVVVAVACVASAVLMAVLYTPGGDPSRVYYGTDTRAQELLAGAVLALVCARIGRFVVARPALRVVADLAGVAALAAVCGLVAGVDDHTTWLYRGGLLLFSAIVVVVIVACVQPRGVVEHLLGNPVLRWLGSISYGLYLWHWPIYVVATSQRMGFGGTRLLLFRLGATVVVATLSFYLVEQPIRTGRVPTRALAALLPAAAIAIVVGTLVVTEGAVATPDLLAGPPAASVPSAVAIGSTGPATPDPHATRVVLTGDSVSLTIGKWGMPEELAKPRAQFWDESILGCTLAPSDMIINGEHDHNNARCDPWRAVRTNWLARIRPSAVVVLSGVWETYDRVIGDRVLKFGTPEFDRWWSAGVDKVFAQFESTGAKLVVLSAPCNDQNVVSGPQPPWNDGRNIDHLNALYRAAVARQGGRATMIDLHGYLCPNGRFQASRDGVPLRDTDGVHFSPSSAPGVWAWLQPRILAAAGVS